MDLITGNSHCDKMKQESSSEFIKGLLHLKPKCNNWMVSSVHTNEKNSTKACLYPSALEQE